ncbi:DUF4254 domain-containing protein [Saprospira sp. CCB-QB6]|uniref:DUF4254 domain-containing protein n=1 Tax=Saprospira sp. CCB-QB6 TaxID=3023936 RepID=UPI00234A787C|nr:DUF4254 domain-containing protein [Saprospira sp. CCB-QB6]WCL80939.1 DUF4254 domain-containing protein [Saprospira sp. CCB-QB6]
MSSFSQSANKIFDEVVAFYHVLDQVDQEGKNPYSADTIEYLLYQKNWIDSVQWHVEDLIREPEIEPSLALSYKRRIDALNQERTDTVERIDDYFLAKFAAVPAKSNRLNTESPAWAIDRLSILALKIYHMAIEAERLDTPMDQQARCKQKLAILLEQREDLSTAIDQLLEELAQGEKQMKVYRQMKMYNDPQLNPVLYQKKA